MISRRVSNLAYKTRPGRRPGFPPLATPFPGPEVLASQKFPADHRETRKNTHDVSPTDGAREPAYLPARPIAPGTLALKFRQPKFFWIESSRAEKNPARNLKNRKIFRSKVENSKKIWRESWKKRCQLGN
jgi:hypothetical protein